MKMKHKMTILGFVLTLGTLTGCVSAEVNGVQATDVTISAKNSLTTKIEFVRIWRMESGDRRVTGRVLQKRHGKLTGHIDIEVSPKFGDTNRLYIAELNTWSTRSKKQKVANFNESLGLIAVNGSTVELRYHEGTHDLL